MHAFTLRPLRLPLVALSVALALSACANNNAAQGLDGANGGINGPATPGSAAEFASAAVGDRVWFDLNSSVVNGAGQATLGKQAQWLRKYTQYTAVIEGHADERGTDDYNFQLGDKRASAAKAYLASLGVAANRLATKSYGKSRPVAQCTEGDDACQSQNRRAVTVLSGR